MRRLWLAVQVLLVGLVLIYLAESVAGNWADIRGAGQAIRIAPGPLAVSAAIILATYALLVGAWRGVLNGWGEQLRYPAAARIWTLSNLARYIPGRVWQIAGMAALAQQAGVTPWAAAGSAIIVQLLAVATGTLVTVAFAVRTEYPVAVMAAGVIAALAVAALTLERPTAFATRLLRRLTGRDLELRPVRTGPLLVSALITTFSWIAYGAVLALFARGVLGTAALSVGTAIGSFTASYLLGLIAVFTPGGLGVREVSLYLLLEGPIGPAGATVVSVGSRILMTVTEILAALITLPLTHRKPA